MVGHGSKFTRKKEAAIAALLTHRNVEEAARAAGIGTQTLYRWMKHPEFKAALRKAKQAVYGQASIRLQQGTQAAATTVLKIMLDNNSPPSVRLRAADLILSHAHRANESEQIEERIAILERELNRPPY